MNSKNNLVLQDGKYYGYDTLGGRLYDLDTIEYLDEKEPEEPEEDGEEETVNEDISTSSLEAKTVQTQKETKSK